ncbi:MAG: 16S rRNA (cytidine(1402)-2'-O)-methyltransferase [Verrucomicrobia bacterium]|nr:16S rRNA (cytidine(1402)-2'-O)-methyltransferase [Verrucomicrobiota bacterium]
MLYIVATPIGNLDDISARAIKALRDSDIVACEDTRRTRILLEHCQMGRPQTMVSYREQTEHRAGGQLVQQLLQGRNVALCSDGGFPGISDPGYRLVNLAIENGIKFEVIPGASAVHVALLYSGLSTSSYTFKGFPPRKRGPAVRFFGDEKDLPHTMVIFESPFRVGPTLEHALEALGNRKAAVCIELTKKFERISRGYLADLVKEYSTGPVKGEVTIVIAGNNPKFAAVEEDGEAPADDAG